MPSLLDCTRAQEAARTDTLEAVVILRRLEERLRAAADALPETPPEVAESLVAADADVNLRGTIEYVLEELISPAARSLLGATVARTEELAASFDSVSLR